MSRLRFCACLILGACSEDFLQLPSNAKAGDLIVVTGRDPKIYALGDALNVSFGVEDPSDADAFLVPQRTLVNGAGEIFSPEVVAQLRVRAKGSEAPPGSCNRCLVPDSEDVHPRWPGDACAIPANSFALGELSSSEAAQLRESYLIDFPGDCPCISPNFDDTHPDSADIKVLPNGEILPFEFVTNLPDGRLVAIGQDMGWVEGRAPILRRRFLPGRVAIGAATSSAVWVVHDDPNLEGYGTSISELSPELSIRANTPFPEFRIDAVHSTPDDGLLLFGRKRVNGGNTRSQLQFCRTPELSCQSLFAERASRRGTGGVALAASDSGWWVAAETGASEGARVFFERFPRGEVSQIELTQTLTDGEVGTWTDAEGTARWRAIIEPSAVEPGVGHTSVFGLAATSHRLFEAGSTRDNTFRLRSIRVEDDFFSGSPTPFEPGGDFETGSVISGLTVDGERVSGIVTGPEPRYYLECQPTGLCATSRTSSTAIAAIERGLRLERVGDQSIATTGSRIFRRSPSGWSQVLGSPTRPGIREVIPFDTGFLVVTERTIEQVVGSESTILWTAPPGRTPWEATLSGNDVVLAATETTPQCPSGRSVLQRFNPDTRTSTDLADLGECRKVTAMAAVGVDQVYLATSDGGVSLMRGNNLEEVEVLGSEDVGSVDEHWNLASWRENIALFGGSHGSIARIQPWTSPPSMQVAQVADLPDPTKQVAPLASCVDEVFGGIRGVNASSQETGSLYRVSFTAGTASIVDENIRARTTYGISIGSGNVEQLGFLGDRLLVTFWRSLHLAGDSERRRLGFMAINSLGSNGRVALLGDRGGELVEVRLPD